MIKANLNMNSTYLMFSSFSKFINPCLLYQEILIPVFQHPFQFNDIMEMATHHSQHFISSSKMQRKIIQTLTVSSFILPVQPDPPVNVTLELKKPMNRKPYLVLTWSPPPLADVRSGWLTLEYELRLKPEEGEEWEVRMSQIFARWSITVCQSGHMPDCNEAGTQYLILFQKQCLCDLQIPTDKLVSQMLLCDSRWWSTYF